MLKKILFITAISSSFIHTAFASTATDFSVKKAVELSHVEQTFNQSMQNLTPMFDNQAIKMVQNRTKHETLSPQEQKAAQDISQIFQADAKRFTQQTNMAELTQQIFKKYYSEQELQVYIKFLESPEGQSINKKLPLVVQETAQEVANIANNPQAKIDQQQANQKISEILKALPQATP